MEFDWNYFYLNGGKSGDPKDYKISNKWKHDIISKYFTFDTESIIDMGCGDLQFWEDDIPKNYIGVDISQEIINRNKLKYNDRIFIASDASIDLNISANVVICFDMLFHIQDDETYIDILKNIKSYSKNYIVTYTWNRNPFSSSLFKRLEIVLMRIKHKGIISFKSVDNDGGYQKYRDYLKIASPIFEPEFKLVASYTHKDWDLGTICVWERIYE